MDHYSTDVPPQNDTFAQHETKKETLARVYFKYDVIVELSSHNKETALLSCLQIYIHRTVVLFSCSQLKEKRRFGNIGNNKKLNKFFAV